MSEIIASGIVKPGPLQELIDTYDPIVSEFRIHLNQDGIHVRALDPATVAYAITDLKPGIFESYDSPGTVTIGVNLERLEEALGIANKDDLVGFKVDMETRKLNIEVRNIKQKVRLIDPESMRNEPNEPEGLDTPNQFTTKAARLKEAVEVSGMVSDHLRVKCNPESEHILVTAKGDDDESVVEFGHDEVVDAQVSAETESIYSVEYLECLTKPMPDDAEVTLTLGTDMPMFLDWEASDGYQVTRSFQAPRIVGD